LPLHGGLVVRNGVGVVLAGPSGVGKSTCCQRIPQPWFSPCDDEVLLVKGSRGEIRVHPFPTLGDFQQYRSSRSWQVQESFSLKGILFLDRAERKGICFTGQGEAAILINDSAREVVHQYASYMTSSDAASLRSQILDLACGLAQEIPVLRLSVSRTGEFWIEIERALGLGE
jgi:SynChlorMet cassette protein ScmC